MIVKRICLYCNKEFVTTKPNQVYCIPQHQTQHTIQKDREENKRKKLEFESKVLNEYRNRMRYKQELQKAFDWFELLKFDKAICSICGMTFSDHMQEYNIPLIMQVINNDIRDYRLLEQDSWIIYCVECYSNIKFMRENLKRERINK